MNSLTIPRNRPAGKARVGRALGHRVDPLVPPPVLNGHRRRTRADHNNDYPDIDFRGQAVSASRRSECKREREDRVFPT